MKQMLCCLLLTCLFTGSLVAADWDANDDSFDPSVDSVVIGDRSWLGDPSPFVLVGPSRTGYTHVRATNYEGFDPSIAISLMVPLEPGETTQPSSGMLMMNKDQSLLFIKQVTDRLKPSDQKAQKRTKLASAYENADWVLVSGRDDSGKRYVQLENKTKDKTDVFRFSENAFKKLLGAIRHSLKKLDAKTNP